VGIELSFLKYLTLQQISQGISMRGDYISRFPHSRKVDPELYIPGVWPDYPAFK